MDVSFWNITEKLKIVYLVCVKYRMFVIDDISTISWLLYIAAALYLILVFYVTFRVTRHYCLHRRNRIVVENYRSQNNTEILDECSESESAV